MVFLCMALTEYLCNCSCFSKKVKSGTNFGIETKVRVLQACLLRSEPQGLILK